MGKLATPEWVMEGYDSKAAWEKSKGISKKKETGKIFKIKECPKCHSDNVGIILSNSDAEEGGGKEWQCLKCRWKGKNIIEKELNEDEFLKSMEEK